MTAEDPVAGWLAARSSGTAVLLDGFHAVKHALRFGASVVSAVTAGRAAALALATELAPDLVPALDRLLVEVDPATFGRLAGDTGRPGRAVGVGGAAGAGGVGHHTGVAALARRAPWSLDRLAGAGRGAPLIFLDGPRHPGNYGAVVRVAAGLGASGVVSTGTIDPWHPAVVRGAAGLQYAVPVLRVESAAALAGPLVALDAAGRDAREHTMPDNAILAFGSERHGLSPQLKSRADVMLALPMRQGVASYNLASAVAMVLYQWLLSR